MGDEPGRNCSEYFSLGHCGRVGIRTYPLSAPPRHGPFPKGANGRPGLDHGLRPNRYRLPSEQSPGNPAAGVSATAACSGQKRGAGVQYTERTAGIVVKVYLQYGRLWPSRHAVDRRAAQGILSRTVRAVYPVSDPGGAVQFQPVREPQWAVEAELCSGPGLVPVQLSAVGGDGRILSGRG